MIAAVSLGLAGRPAAAAPSETISYTSDGTSAYASSYECVTERRVTTCTYTDLYVFDGRTRESDVGFSGTRVCLFVYTEQYSGRRFLGSTQESGCTVDADGAFTAANNLSSATLSPTKITLDQLECTYDPATDTETCTVVSSRDTTVSAEFTATGSLVKSSQRGTFSDGTCTFTYSSRGSGREASVVLTLDGQVVSGDTYAFIEDGRTTFKETCK